MILLLLRQAYNTWRGQNGRHAHIIVTPPRGLHDMVCGAAPDVNIINACKGLRCFLIDEVDALLTEDANASKYIFASLVKLKDLAATM